MGANLVSINQVWQTETSFPTHDGQRRFVNYKFCHCYALPELLLKGNLNHRCGKHLAVSSSNSSKYTISHTYLCTITWHKAPYLCHQHIYTHLFHWEQLIVSFNSRKYRMSWEGLMIVFAFITEIVSFQAVKAAIQYILHLTTTTL